MKKLIKTYLPGLVIVVIAGWIIRQEYEALDYFYQWRKPTAIENPFFVAMATWGIRFLLLSLLMSPIYAFTGWRFPLKLRKPLGLVAFGFVSIHVYIYLTAKRAFDCLAIINQMPSQYECPETYGLMELLFRPSFVIFGTIAFLILALMAATSIKPTMKLMGRFWKPLHRLVYVAAISIMVHIIVAASSGKRAFVGGEEALSEYQLYLVALVVLLVVRVPIIKHSLQRVIPFAPNPRKAKPKNTVLAS